MWYSHVVQALGNVGPRKPEPKVNSLMQGTTVLKTIMGGASVSKFVCAGSLYTGNELEK